MPELMIGPVVAIKQFKNLLKNQVILIKKKKTTLNTICYHKPEQVAKGTHFWVRRFFCSFHLFMQELAVFADEAKILFNFVIFTYTKHGRKKMRKVGLTKKVIGVDELVRRIKWCWIK